ncbi:MAG TPA: hypothetical protein PLZ95_15780 [Bryobacteraceae bacterium]|nr:hypothetical protein [Bryobacteraceae bacterium]
MRLIALRLSRPSLGAVEVKIVTTGHGFELLRGGKGEVAKIALEAGRERE